MTKGNTWLNVFLTALAPTMWGSTYIVTTELLPDNMPLLASTIRALPAGLLLLLICRTMPSGKWWGRIAILGALNIGAFFYCLFMTAYYLPGGVASLVMSIQPMIVIALSALVLNTRFLKVHIYASLLGIAGIALLVLNSTINLNWQGVVSGLIGTTCMATGIVFTKHWGRPEGLSLLGFTGWQLTFGGLMLLPIALFQEGVPATLTATNIAGYAYLSLVGALLGYMLWFRGIERLPAVTISFLGFLSSLAALFLGYVFLDQTFTTLQILGAVAIVACVYLSTPKPQPEVKEATSNADDRSKLEEQRA